MTQRTTGSDSTQGHGFDAEGKAFAQASLALYLLLSSRSGIYARQSELAANCSGSLMGKRVLDIGCGFGTTSLAIMDGVPSEIIGIDNAPDQIVFYSEILMGATPASAILDTIQAQDVLSPAQYDRVVSHIEQMRSAANNNLFSTLGNTPQAEVDDLLTLSPANYGQFDVVVCGNMFHWALNARRKELEQSGMETQQAYFTAFTELAETLQALTRPGGTLIITEPPNFVRHKDRATDQMIVRETAALSHPVFTGMWKIASALRGMPHTPKKPTDLFNTGTIAELFSGVGFDLKTPIPFFEQSYGPLDKEGMLEVAYATLPMQMASDQSRSMAEKLVIARQALEQARSTFPDEYFARPMKLGIYAFVGTRR